jgi:branched-chain amino acid transport system ATP-binding protein
MYAALRSRWKNEERGILNKSVGIIKNLNLAKGAEIPSRNLSGGQKKLLELGRSTMSGARMILLDEPIAGVNPTLAIEIFERITEICKSEGITFLIVEHRLDIALQYTDTVFALNLGKIIAKGTPDEVTSHPEVIRSYLGG